MTMTPELLAMIKDVPAATDEQIAQLASHYDEPDAYAHDLHVQSLIARIVAERKEWQDISTAPKDGTAILAFNCRHMTHAPVVVVWKTDPDVEMVGDEPHWADAATKLGTALYYNGNYFSHWMPLPTAPAPVAAPVQEAQVTDAMVEKFCSLFFSDWEDWRTTDEIKEKRFHRVRNNLSAALRSLQSGETSK